MPEAPTSSLSGRSWGLAPFGGVRYLGVVDPVTETLISAGPLGAIIIALGVAYWRQGLALKLAQEARVEDAKLVTSTLLELNDRWNTTVNGLTTAVDRLADRLSN